VWRGCKAAAGDLAPGGANYLGRTNSNGPLITTNMPLFSFSAAAQWTNTGTFTTFESINFAGAFSGGVLRVAADSAIVNCVVSNSSTNASAMGFDLITGTRSSVINSDASLTGASGGIAAIRLTSTTAGRVMGSRVTAISATANGISADASVCIAGNVIFKCGNNGIALGATTQSAHILNNTIVGCGGDGINVITGTTGTQFISMNLITDNVGYAIDAATAAIPIFAVYNRYDRNTAGATNLATDSLAALALYNNTTSVSQATEYTNYAGNDFRLLSGSPAAGAGWLPFADIGALERQSSASGSLLTNSLRGNML
jgi:hypothetical protein